MRILITLLLLPFIGAAQPKPIHDTTAKYFYLIADQREWQLLYKLSTTPRKLTGEQIDSALALYARIQPLPTDTTKTKKPK